MTEPELLSSTSHVVDTVDFALLSVGGKWDERPDSLMLATSNRSGAIGLVTGSNYSRVTIAMERWSSRPPTASNAWEDQDEIPYEPNSTEIYASGFDAPEEGDPFLDVTGLGRSRARVCVNGRRFAERLSDTEDQTDEEWLIQLWPDDEALTGMVGGPRVLAAQRSPVPDIQRFVTDTGPEAHRDLLHSYPVMWDLLHLVNWEADQRLSEKVEDLAVRLAVSPEHIVGGAYALVQWDRARSDVDIPSLGIADTLQLRRGSSSDS